MFNGALCDPIGHQWRWNGSEYVKTILDFPYLDMLRLAVEAVALPANPNWPRRLDSFCFG